ncbi:MAG: DUF882 domain-containing protein [Polyangiaceae bacterium]
MTHRSLRRALSLAFVMAATAFAPLVVSGTALAAPPKEPAGASSADKPGADGTEVADSASKPAKPAKPAKSKSKSKTKTKKRTAAKPHAKGHRAHAKGSKTTPKSPKSKRAHRQTKSSTKRGKPAPKSDDSPAARAPTSKPDCTAAEVSLDRAGVEAVRLPLTDCKGKPLDAAVRKVSVLARPWGAPKRTPSSRVDAGVVKRLAAIAKKLPGRTITLLGAPGAPSGVSAHQTGHAVDLRVDGVESAKLAEVCRTLADTGCGFYPNASFVHLDVRADGAGKTSWIDASEPGEPPRYVRSWPPPSAGDSSDTKPTSKPTPATKPASAKPDSAKADKATKPASAKADGAKSDTVPASFEDKAPAKADPAKPASKAHRSKRSAARKGSAKSKR